jgi:Rad3-related DNA helicase
VKARAAMLQQSAARENPWRALDPDAFDKGEKINRCADELRRLAVSQTSTESCAIVALQTALGNEIAASVVRDTQAFCRIKNCTYWTKC